VTRVASCKSISELHSLKYLLEVLLVMDLIGIRSRHNCSRYS
jgi:hypothetical protein